MFDWVTGFLEQSGYGGIAVLMLLENVFPPIPSELIMPFAGYAASRGDLQIVPVILAGTLGTVAGALFWYYVGRWLGLERLQRFADRHGRWLTLSPKEVVRADRWFDRFGIWAVLFGRLLPAIRTLISVPAGLSGMRLLPFLLATTAGSAAWTAFLALLGYFMGSEYQAIETWLNPVSDVVIGLMIAWYLYRVATFGRGQGRDGGNGGQPRSRQTVR
ncbi:DedA family protein [Marinibaculum pumilum]|uniref:DedA family protein n=1 Tax=Marinibaculum pumilum TaxID=1766165 RepID=A0ABV7L7K6_9PROT